MKLRKIFVEHKVMREHVYVWLCCLVIAMLIGLAWVGAIVMVEELDHHRLQKCWEKADICERVNGRWTPAARFPES